MDEIHHMLKNELSSFLYSVLISSLYFPLSMLVIIGHVKKPQFPFSGKPAEKWSETLFQKVKEMIFSWPQAIG